MDEERKKTCENCKREIPAVNFTIHNVHCARNIRVCPICKEPVHLIDLQDHHTKFHKLLPCKKCGESVCGTDLEDHIRDSCAHTMTTCRFCALELRRGAMPAHERYCGARTEHCADCGEWVMLKYRQLHLDSNHGFIRLSDDPVPMRKDVKLINEPRRSNLPTSSTDRRNPNNGIINEQNVIYIDDLPIFSNMPSTSRQANGPSMSGSTNSSRSNSSISSVGRAMPSLSNVNMSSNSNANVNDALAGTSSAYNGAIPRSTRTNEQLQVDTAMAQIHELQRDMWASRGAMKKRFAPKPPNKISAAQKMEMSLKCLLERRQAEERQREEQTGYNLTVDLPPVPSAAAKLEKPRNLDALQNPVADNQDNENCLQQITPAGVLDSSNIPNSNQNLEASRRNSKSKSPDRRIDLRNFLPMSPEDFIKRFSNVDLRHEDPCDVLAMTDRFSQIKSSLRELRRDLNEVTAPYNLNANNDAGQNNRERSPEDEDDVTLPCEFCNALVPLDDLVQHQTGCRPDLTQVKPKPKPKPKPRPSPSPSPSPSSNPNPTPTPNNPPDSQDDPVIFIPCEFCTQPQPVYLLSDHQERCGRDSNLLFPD